MKMKCIALDDEPLALSQMTAYIGRTAFLELAATFHNASDALSWLDRNRVDLIFADINMPGLNGLDFVRSLRQKHMIIFTTAYDKYALEGFRVDATDYLLKPIGYNDFLRSAEKALRQFRLLGGDSGAQQGSETIFVKSGHKVMPVETDKILYIESQSEYVRIFTESHKPFMTLGSLKSWEEKLPSVSFMRVHRSYIVNLHKIVSVEHRRIVLAGGATVPIGGLYLECVKKYLGG